IGNKNVDAPAGSVLQYHWVLKTNGISGFSADVEMTYYESDVYVEAPYNVSDYITARLLNDGSGSWNKYTSDDFDESNQLLKFAFTNVDDEEIEGDYTAGIDDAIPDQVPFYETNQSGSWTNGAIWTPNVSGGPQGAMVLINADDTVYMPSNFQKSYITTIDGRAEVDSTFGHRLGEVDGTGTLYTKRASLPAGDYTDFFSSSGGTLEYGGIGPDYDILASFSYVNNLKLSGTGERRFPNQDITLLGDLIIDGEDATLEVINDHDQKITIEGDISFVTGSFDAGSGASAIVEMNGSAAQTITGSFTGTDEFYHFTINNSNGVNLSGPIDINGDLTFTSGIITSSAANILSITNIASTVSGYGSSNYVDGPMRKLLSNGSTFEFPVGDASRYGLVEVVSTNTSGSQYWEAEYYNANPHASYDTSSRLAPLEMVSGNEYWRIEGPAAGTRESGVKIRWDANSILPAMTDDRPNNLHIAEWIGGGTDEWQSVGSGPANIVDNGINDGTIKTSAAVALDEHYFTIGTEESTPLPTAGFLTLDTTICDGATVGLRVQLTGDPNWTIYVWDGTSTNTYAAIATSPYSFDVSPGVTTTYTIDSVSDNTPITTGATIFGSPVIVTVTDLPALQTVNGGGGYCAGGAGVAVGLDGSEAGMTYELYLGGVPTGSTVAGSGAAVSFGNQTAAGTYTVEATNDANTNCTQTMTGNAVVTINPLPVASIVATAAVDTVCDGTNTELTVTVTIGAAPFDITVSDGTDSDNTPAYTPPPDWTFNPGTAPVYDGTPGGKTTYTYTITTITDNNGCTDTNLDTVDVVVVKEPVTGNVFANPN
ncbi:hypothetical protein ACFLSE_10610, partial [Bacteroidota bacterium]